MPYRDYVQIDWQKYLSDIYSLAEITVPSTERVIVTETDYLKKLVALLDVTPTRTIGTEKSRSIIQNPKLTVHSGSRL